MDPGIYVAMTGGIVQQKRLDSVTQNLANASTLGYKREVTAFRQFLLSAYSQMGLDFSPGPVKRTDNPTDMVILGEGFFVVKTPAGMVYTRRGDFILNAKGELVTKDGFPVQGMKGNVKVNGEFKVSPVGEVKVNGEVVDALRVVKFPSETPIVSLGGGYYGSPPGIIPKKASNFTINQGATEESNVDIVKEMVSMIEVLRSYELCQKMIQAEDEATSKIIADVGVPRG